MRFFFDFLFTVFLILSLPRAISRWLSVPEYRGMFRRRFFCPRPTWVQGKPKIWINGVSVGEIASARPLIEGLEEEFPDIRMVISCTTGTGYQMAKRLYPDHQIIGYPLDISFIVSLFMLRLKPDVICNMELDLWPNFLESCRRRKIPFFVISGRISESSAKGFASVRGLFRYPLRGVAKFLAQDELDAKRAVAMGIEADRVEVGGNLKFDLVKTEGSEELPSVCKIILDRQRPCFICASTHYPEEEAILKILSSDKRLHWTTILVPRHPERTQDVVAIAKRLGFDFCLFSQLEQGECELGELMIVDRIGVLFSLYQVSDICFVGKSLLAKGGQNMIEPAALGVAVFYGPHVANFREASKLLLEGGGAVQVDDLKDFEKTLQKLMDEPDVRKNIGQKGKNIIENRKGAAKYALQQICGALTGRT